MSRANPPHRRRRLARLAGAAALLAAAAPALAQSLDYDSFEQLFHEPVTSSATGQPQRASEAPVNMEIITQDDIRRSGATSIPDVLQFAVGVDVRRYGIVDSEVGLRGFNSQYNPRLLVMINGREVYSGDYGHVAWPTLPVQLDEIRQIEVIKGPNSALYGFNAVSGVINIITYNPLYDKVNAATLRGGSQNYASGSAVGTAQFGENAGVRISLGGAHAKDFASANLPVVENWFRQSPQVGALAVDARVRLAPGVEADLEASKNDSRFSESLFDSIFDTLFARTESVRLGLSADSPIGLLAVGAYHNGQRLAEALPTESPTPDVHLWNNNTLTVVQAGDLLKLGTAHTLRLGIEYRQGALQSPNFVDGTISDQVFAASAMWNWQIAPSLALTSAMRLDTLRLHYAGTLVAASGQTLADYNRVGFSAPSANVGLVYRASDRDTLRLMLAHGVQLPSLVNFGLQISGPVASVVGSPWLRPATVDNIGLDYDRALPAIGSTLRTALFAQRNAGIIDDGFSAAPTVGPTGLLVLQAAPVARSESLGAEIAFKGRSASGWRWQASYALVATTDQTLSDRAQRGAAPVTNAHSVPQNVLIGSLGRSWNRVEFDVLGRWQSGYRDFTWVGGVQPAAPAEIDPFLTLTARAGYRLTDHVTAALVARQFNAPHLLEAAGPKVERQFIASLTARF